MWGVEPNDDMRQKAETLLASFSRFSSVQGTAEATTLPGANFDFVTAAQAFHWFDRSGFKAECRRILKPGGRVVLVWNNYEADNPLIRELESLKKALCPDFNAFSSGEDFTPARFADFFKDGRCEYRAFRNDQAFDEEAFVGASLSSSYVPKRGDEKYGVFLDGLRKIFARYAKEGIAVRPATARSYVGEV